jgi:hypothetical protein
MVAARSLPSVVLLGLAAAGLSAGGCTTGTTPVCDDAGSCLILPTEASVDAGVVEASAGSDGGDGSTSGDAPAE